MTMKSVDLPHLRSVVLAGHAGAGKTTLAEQLLFKAGAIPRLGRVDDGTAHLDFEPEEQKRRESLSLAVGTFERDGTRISLRRHARLPGLRRRRHRGLRRRRRRALRHGRLGRRRGRASSRPSRSAARPGTAACFFINKSDRENADPTAALDALRAAFGDKIAPLQIAIGAAESFSGYVDLVHRKAWSWDGIEGGRDPDPRRPGRRGRAPPRPAARGGRRGRRRRPDQVPRGRGDLRPRAGGLPAQGRQGERPGARPRRQRGQGHRPARPARRDRALPPLPGRRAAGEGDRQGRRDGRGPRRRGRAAPRARVQDHGRPVRRTPDVPARALRARSTRRPTSGTRRAARTSGSASCCCSTARSRSRSASSRPARSARSRSSR